MKIGVVGCGAVGSLFAGHLARLEDVEVYAFDVARPHVDAIRERGLRISGRADFTVRLHATADPAELPRCDFGIVATKSIHTRAAIAHAARAFDTRSAVCSVQNGLGNEEIIAEYVSRVIRGTTFPAGHLVEPGHVCYDIQGTTWIGPFEPAGAPFETVEQLAALLNRAGLETVALRDARGAQWTKLVFNASTNPVGALTGLHHGAATFFPATGELFDALIAEGEQVAEALGIELDHDPRELVRFAAKAPGKHKSSMLQDVEAGRPTEVDFMNGAIVREGERMGVPTPLNRALWALVKGLEHSWSNP
ncbi:MAG TPA: ketopantoate reductase family protein [Candidatus Acidoferrales bacterium]|nr:ketopantoate reductase family protein [Candidatus Acidoferrales bacterium]